MSNLRDPVQNIAPYNPRDHESWNFAFATALMLGKFNNILNETETEQYFYFSQRFHAYSIQQFFSAEIFSFKDKVFQRRKAWCMWTRRRSIPGRP
jgi:hypothetical protein